MTDLDYLPQADKICAEKDAALQWTRKKATRNSMCYLGVPEDCMFILNLLASKLDQPGSNMTSLDAIYLVLMKIRTNRPFTELADDFGICVSRVSQLFNKYIDDIDAYLAEFIFWPSAEEIEKNVPIQFKARYSKVQSIIDCFEIQVQKPQNPMNQALTWSNYKGCNTLKYFVSITPDGVINFISEGYGGRASDLEITKDCGYLSCLPDFSVVLADRGFKNIESVLASRKSRLIRPVSVREGEVMTRRGVIKKKKIATICIHVEMHKIA